MDDERYVLQRLSGGSLFLSTDWSTTGWKPQGKVVAVGSKAACEAAKRLLELPCTE